MTSQTTTYQLAPRSAHLLLEWPRLTLLVAVLTVIVAAAGLAGVSKDPSVDAFVPGDHPAALARDRAREYFGLEDPIVVGLAAPAGEHAFTPARLEALRRIDEGVRRIEGVRKPDVVSLATERAISGDDGDLLVDPILEDGPLSPATAELARERFRSMPMLSGLLASAGEDLLTVLVPVEDPNHAQEEVRAVIELAEQEAGAVFDVHVAGVAAMNARLASMVDTDTRIFVPAAVVTVLLILLLALRRPVALLGPLFVIAGAAAVAIGLMGWVGARYYLITTALPVVIMAIAVADCLHLGTYYLRARAEDVACSAEDAVRAAIARAWLPITLTSVTTIAAFLGLSSGAAMRPISEFGLFAAVGVAAAWVLSLTALPAILVLTDLRPSTGRGSVARDGTIDAAVRRVTALAFRYPIRALAGVLLLANVLGGLALQAEFDYERQRYFTAGDPVRVADREINARLGGVNFLDVVVTASEPGGLLEPQVMQAMAELRAEMAALPLAVKATGIDEYISLMHQVLTGASPGSLPTGARAPGQYLFLYEASAPPEDFKQQIDYDQQHALLRAQLSTDRYSQTVGSVDALEALVTDWSARTGLAAAVSGRVAVNDGWMRELARTHVRGLLVAVALVLLASAVAFRSLRYGVFAMIPVLVGVVSVYATMGAFGIDIAPATSMTAAIATGLGVDFGIHLLSLVRQRRREGAHGLEAFSGSYTVVARACFFSALALGVALAVICVSSAPPLRWFGLLVSLGAFGSLLGALVVVPALWSVGTSLARREDHV
ncbi:MAG: MMPL family transporter [Pseudomonadales bacterium]|jgi:predicted RND superfamily exporter protein|nr:MMPL family transporter [Pseudomonadales bacterium]